MELKAENVNEIFIDCLYSEDRLKSYTKEELMEKAILVEGIVTKVGFDPEKIALNKPKIIALLAELPDLFKYEVGGGFSFLSACVDKHGHHWGEQMDAERLLMLGMACKRVDSIFPRVCWCVLPGGVPYYVIYTSDTEGYDRRIKINVMG